jgi:transposase
MSALPAVVVWRRAMQVVHPRCAGLDVHKRSVVACRLIPGPGAQALRAVRTFGTTTRELLALVGWLAEEAVTHVAMGPLSLTT